MRPTDEQIEAKARTLCETAGQDPDARFQEYGRTSYSHAAWHLWRDAAVKALTNTPEGLNPTGEQGKSRLRDLEQP